MDAIPISRDDFSFWAAGPDAQPGAPLDGDARADIVVVGGGFAGLSAAYHLVRARPDLDIVVLESNRVGSGASGRNTGMLGPRVGGTIVDLCRRYGRDEARRLYQASIDAVRQVKALVAEEGIACELEETRQVKGAITRGHAAALKTEAQLLEALGFAAPLYDEGAMARISPVPYRAGLCYPESALLNPLRLCRELKRIVLERGVRVYERTVVERVVPGQPATIVHRSGTVKAGLTVLATNAYTAQLGFMRGRVIPIQTHVMQTAPLSPAQLGRLNWTGRTPFFETGRLFNYFRLTADDRIVFGGGRPVYAAADNDRRNGATDVADPSVWQAQARVFATRFPALRDVSIGHTWAGTVAMTLDHAPVVGQVTHSPGVFFAGGWNGHGVAMATASGATIADCVLGRRSARTTFPWVRGDAPRLAIDDPVRAFGLSVYLASLGLRDRLDRLADRIRSGSDRPRGHEEMTWTSGH